MSHPIGRTVARIKSAVLASRCQLATGKLDKDGCPRVWVDGKSVPAHIHAWESSGRGRPPGKVIRHLCGDKRCVNLDHLTLGTRKQNKDDELALRIAVRELVDEGQAGAIMQHMDLAGLGIDPMLSASEQAKLRLNIRLQALVPSCSETSPHGVLAFS